MKTERYLWKCFIYSCMCRIKNESSISICLKAKDITSGTSQTYSFQKLTDNQHQLLITVRFNRLLQTVLICWVDINPVWSLHSSPPPKIVFNRLNGKRYHSAATQKTASPAEGFTQAHEENVRFVYEGESPRINTWADVGHSAKVRPLGPILRPGEIVDPPLNATRSEVERMELGHSGGQIIFLTEQLHFNWLVPLGATIWLIFKAA